MTGKVWEFVIGLLLIGYSFLLIDFLMTDCLDELRIRFQRLRIRFCIMIVDRKLRKRTKRLMKLSEMIDELDQKLNEAPGEKLQ